MSFFFYNKSIIKLRLYDTDIDVDKILMLIKGESDRDNLPAEVTLRESWI